MASTELQRYDLPWAFKDDQWLLLPDGTVRKPLNMDDWYFWRTWGFMLLGWWSIKVTHLPEHGCRVSTCFVGIDMDPGLGWDWSDMWNPVPPDGYMPLLFETMVFGGELNLEKSRCHTIEQARIEHEEMVAMVKGKKPAAYQCPACGMVSHNPNDAANRYCGNCHRFEDDPEGLPDESGRHGNAVPKAEA